MNKQTIRALLVFAVATALMGCGPKYDQDGPKFFDVKSPLYKQFPPQKTWKISATGADFRDIENAIDGSTHSIAQTSGNYTGAEVTIDFGRSCLMNLIVILHGPKAHGFCRKVELLTSNDGKIFTHRRTVEGLRKITSIPILTSVTARFVKFKVIQQGTKSWSLGEIYFQ